MDFYEDYLSMDMYHELSEFLYYFRSWLPTKPKSVYDPYLGNDTIDWRNFMGQNFVSPVR